MMLLLPLHNTAQIIANANDDSTSVDQKLIITYGMPFTVSHVSAVLPLRKSRLSFSALVIGSMSPDFSYILELLGVRVEAHSFAGLIFFCVPISYFVWWSYTLYLQPAWEHIFPWLHAEQPQTKWFLGVASVFIGADSHIVWDSFTHRTGWAVQRMDLLSSLSFTYGNTDLPLYKVLQYASSVIGGAVVLYCLNKTIRSHHLRWFHSKQRLVAVLVATVLVFILISAPMTLQEMGESENPSQHDQLIGKLLFRWLAAMAVIIYALPFFNRFLARRSR